MFLLRKRSEIETLQRFRSLHLANCLQFLLEPVPKCLDLCSDFGLVCGGRKDDTSRLLVCYIPFIKLLRLHNTNKMTTRTREDRRIFL
jgi:hypothetical protein